MNPITFIASLLVIGANVAAAQAPPVRVAEDDKSITLDNDLLALTFSKQRVEFNSIKLYDRDGQTRELGNGADALYFDVNGGAKTLPPDLEAKRPRAGYFRLGQWGKSIKLIADNPERAEVVVSGGPTQMFPFENETHWVLPRGTSGVYAYSIYRHGKGMPAAFIDQTRFVIKGVPGTKLFTNHVVDDRRKGPFPTGKVAETVQDATVRFEDGSVYTKYDLTAFNCDDQLHGMAGSGVGIWTIWPSREFLNGGPLRQDLTVHEENVLLAMFQSVHFGAGQVSVADDEEWSKCYGPVFFYVNTGESVDAMFDDAKRRAADERAGWPFAWLKNQDYAIERSRVTGRVQMSDDTSTAGAWAILSPSSDGDLDWALSAKGYQFWTKLDADGRFEIDKVRPGRYTLAVSGADQFVDFKKTDIEVKPNSATDLGTLTWTPIAHGKKLWQIGIADRSTREFRDGDNPRNYDTFKNYFKAFPSDVTFTIGASREKEDWNYAQWAWFNSKPYWTIRFDIGNDVSRAGKATLTLGIAAAQPAGDVIINVNGTEVARFSLKKSGAAAYRSASQDSAYNLKLVEFDASLLKPGNNELTLGQSKMIAIPTGEELKKAKRPAGAIMYDAIRLEVAP